MCGKFAADGETIDWQERSSARAKMRMLIKKLLRKHRYPPEGMEDAVQTVMTQCELWTDTQDMAQDVPPRIMRYAYDADIPIAAEGTARYGKSLAFAAALTIKRTVVNNSTFPQEKPQQIPEKSA